MESVDGEWYVFIVDEDDKFVSHATVPANVGQDLNDPKFTDANGAEYGKRILAATDEGIWVNYLYFNPAYGNREENKHTWVVKHDGPIFGSGWYAGARGPTSERNFEPGAYAKHLVQQAIQRYQSAGREASIAYHNSMESVDGPWYVLIIDETNTMVAPPEQGADRLRRHQGAGLEGPTLRPGRGGRHRERQVDQVCLSPQPHAGWARRTEAPVGRPARRSAVHLRLVGGRTDSG